jgi:hypothetical protein
VTNIEALIEEYKERSARVANGDDPRKLVRVTVRLDSAALTRLAGIADRFRMTSTGAAEEILEAALREVEQRLAAEQAP